MGAKVTSDTAGAVNALNGRIDFTNKDLAAIQECWRTTQNSLNDCFNEAAVVNGRMDAMIKDFAAMQQSSALTFRVGQLEEFCDLSNLPYFKVDVDDIPDCL